MTKKIVPLIFIFGLMNIANSCSSDPALSLSIPKEGFEVVQHQPAQSTLRQQNPLYQPARAITQKERSGNRKV